MCSEILIRKYPTTAITSDNVLRAELPVKTVESYWIRQFYFCFFHPYSATFFLSSI